MMELKLDTNALSSLIDADPSFKLAIQQAVLQNIANRYIKSTDYTINKLMSDMQSQALDLYTNKDRYGSRSLLPAQRAEFQKIIDSEIQDLIKNSLRTLEPIVKASIDDAFNKFDKQYIDKALDRLLDKYTIDYIQTRLNDRWQEAIKSLTK